MGTGERLAHGQSCPLFTGDQKRAASASCVGWRSRAWRPGLTGCECDRGPVPVSVILGLHTCFQNKLQMELPWGRSGVTAQGMGVGAEGVMCVPRAWMEAPQLVI